MHERVIDALWLAPPEPMELTLAALEVLKPDEQIRLLIHREPNLLFQILEEWGYEYRTQTCDDGTYEILIRLKKRVVSNGDQVSS